MELGGFNSVLALNQSFIVSVKLIVSNNCSKVNHQYIPAL